MDNITGKIVIITGTGTGTGSGLGEAAARHLARLGAIPVLIDHPPRHVRLAAQHGKYLVEMLGTARLVASLLDAMLGAHIEFVTSAADRLMARDRTTLEQKRLDVAQAEMESEIPAHGVDDRCRRKPVTMVERFRLLRCVISGDLANVIESAGIPLTCSDLPPRSAAVNMIAIAIVFHGCHLGKTTFTGFNMSSMGLSSPDTAPQTRYAGTACIERVHTCASAGSTRGESPLEVVRRIADSLEGGEEGAKIAWVIRSRCTGSESTNTLTAAWPMWFRARRGGYEKPLLYLIRSSALNELQSLATETGERGILCNDAETQASGRPGGAPPAIPLWLASHAPCMPYDPASGEEARAIVLAALRALYVDGASGFYYLAAHNSVETSMSTLNERCAEDAVKGMYLSGTATSTVEGAWVRLLGGGKALGVVKAAARLLREDWGVESETWSCPSYTRLAREGHAAERWNLLHPESARRTSHLRQCLGSGRGPTIAATCYPKSIAEQIGAFVPGRFTAIGGDWMTTDSTSGRMKSCVLDERWLTTVALKALADDGQLSSHVVGQAVHSYGLA